MGTRGVPGAVQRDRARPLQNSAVGISPWFESCASFLPWAHWEPDFAHGPDYFSVSLRKSPIEDLARTAAASPTPFGEVLRRRRQNVPGDRRSRPRCSPASSREPLPRAGRPAGFARLPSAAGSLRASRHNRWGITARQPTKPPGDPKTPGKPLLPGTALGTRHAWIVGNRGCRGAGSVRGFAEATRPVRHRWFLGIGAILDARVQQGLLHDIGRVEFASQSSIEPSLGQQVQVGAKTLEHDGTAGFIEVHGLLSCIEASLCAYYGRVLLCRALLVACSGVFR